MEAVYDVSPYTDETQAELHVEGDFEQEHPIEASDIGPYVEVTGYMLWQSPGEKEIRFETYGTGHFYSIDEGAALILESITLTPDSGASSEHWDDWDEEQLAWRDEHAEDTHSMACCEGEDGEGRDNPCGMEHPDGCYGQSLKHLRKS